MYILGALFLLFAAKIMEFIKQLLIISATRRTIDRSPRYYFVSSEVIIQYDLWHPYSEVIAEGCILLSIKGGVPVAGTGCLA